MQGKTCLITGGSDGIGYVAARELALHGREGGHRGPQRRQDRLQQWMRIVAETGNDPPSSACVADLSSQARGA